MTLPPLMPGLKYGERVLGPDSSRAARYGLLKSGKIPTVLVGKLIYVPTLAADRALGLIEEEKQAA